MLKWNRYLVKITIVATIFYVLISRLLSIFLPAIEASLAVGQLEDSIVTYSMIRHILYPGFITFIIYYSIIWGLTYLGSKLFITKTKKRRKK